MLALVIGLVAALIVAALLLVLIKAVRDIERSVNGLLEVAGQVGAQHRQHPAARGHRARARPDRRRGRRPGRLHERADRRLRPIGATA